VKLYPAIDILAGNAVRLVQGDFDAKKVYEQDPLQAARAWVQDGARQLHVVDLDGARGGAPANIGTLARMAAELDVPLQYGGGLRSEQAVREALGAGAARVVIGTAAFTDPELLSRALAEHDPERIVVGVDVRGGFVATHGWMQSTEARASEAFAALRERGVRHFVFTNIDHDGMLDGANREEIVLAARSTGDGSLICSGGIGALSHLEELAELRRSERLDQLAGVVVGTALYEGRFTVAEAQRALAGEL
jgi:phosphoribosylformimino-5-aminoimidazole carboxamide ribotide isomerase